MALYADAAVHPLCLMCGQRCKAGRGNAHQTAGGIVCCYGTLRAPFCRLSCAQHFAIYAAERGVRVPAQLQRSFARE